MARRRSAPRLELDAPGGPAAAAAGARLPASASGIVGLLREQLPAALGANLVGLYAYGSAVAGGFDEGVSDIDLCAVLSQSADQLDLGLLDSLHDAALARHPGWVGRLEVVYAPLAAFFAPLLSAERLAVISPGEPLTLTGPASDWAQNWYLVRETGVTLAGPPARELLPAISTADYLAAVSRYLAHMHSRPHAQLGPGLLAYTVLSVCRALATLASARPCSKQQAAAWLRRRRPEWAWLIDAALACRLARGVGCFGDQPTRAAAADFIRQLAGEQLTATRPQDAPAAAD